MTKEKELELFISKRIFPIIGEINKGLISDLSKALFIMCLEDVTKPIRLTLDSQGGSVSNALAAYDLINGVPCPVECTVIGSCNSAAITVLAACSKRVATKHSRFLFHAMRSGFDIISTRNIEDQVRIGIEQYQIWLDKSLEVQSSAFKISKEEILKMREYGELNDVRLTAEEALEKGVIHKIVEKFDFFSPVT